MVEWKQRVQQLSRFDVETTWKNPRGELIDISSIFKVESMWKCSRQFDVILFTWIRLSKLMKSRGTLHLEFRQRIDAESTKMCPLGKLCVKYSIQFYVLLFYYQNLLAQYSWDLLIMYLSHLWIHYL